LGLKEYKFGFAAENKAANFLKKMKFEILERNFHSKFGEIDIIAKKGEIIHFIEVKATSEDYETAQRIDRKKLEKIIKTINFYFAKNQISADYQIDAVLIEKEQISLLENITI